MNVEIQLFSISKKEKPDYEHGVAHKIYKKQTELGFQFIWNQLEMAYWLYISIPSWRQQVVQSYNHNSSRSNCRF